MKIDERFVDFREQQPESSDLPRKAAGSKRKFERERLPIDSVRKRLCEILKTSMTAIFIGETGSGKSTQIPQMCMEMDLQQEAEQTQGEDVQEVSPKKRGGIIGVTQPRKMAARSLASRVAEEVGCEIGDLVGYKFRFEDHVGPKTRLSYLTDGILLREALHDAFLSRYSTVIVDEAHERSVHTDVLLYILRLAQQARLKAGKVPLRVFLMSATIQSEKFSAYFNQAPVFYIKGRTHPVELLCANEVSADDDDYLHNSVATVLKLHRTEPIANGFLVFLTGQEEIDAACKLVEQEARPEMMKHSITALPLYSSATSLMQAKIFQPVASNSRKVIFSTNIAETSLTIPGIRIVIDSGKVKQKSFTSQNRVDVLKVVNISKAQAIQRAGRAGREAPGKCYRLYSTKNYEKFEEVQSPEILRTNLSSVVLDLVKMGLRRMDKLKLIDPPEKNHLDAAVEELKSLGAIRVSDKGKLYITDHGLQLVRFPVEPSHAKILVCANKLECLEEALTVVAFLSSETVFLSSSNSLMSASTSNSAQYAGDDDAAYKFDAGEGDHVRFIKIYRTFRTQFKNNKNDLKGWCIRNGLHFRRLENIARIRSQLAELCRDQKFNFQSCGIDFTPLRKAICQGLFMNACVYDVSTVSYRLSARTAVSVKIHPSSCLARRKSAMPAFVFTYLVQTSDLFARDVCLIDPDWLKIINEESKKESNRISSA